jgi:hypothetical protein
MRYEIRRYNGAAYDAEFWPDTPLGEVKEYAERVVEDGLADRVEVRDGIGSLVMNIPRVLKPAAGP